MSNQKRNLRLEKIGLILNLIGEKEYWNFAKLLYTCDFKSLKCEYSKKPKPTRVCKACKIIENWK